MQASLPSKDEIYVSTDVETDGPIPGRYSMLSFASAAFHQDGDLLTTFAANLEVLPEAGTDARTMEWWHRHPEAWQQARKNMEPPSRTMRRYLTWLYQLPGEPVFVGYPAAFDFMFVYWYLIRFAGESPFSYAALDIRTLSMALLNTTYKGGAKRNMPAAWFGDTPHTHGALDDAIAQGQLFCNMLAELRRRDQGERTLR